MRKDLVMISKDQIDSFNKNGYVVIDNVISEDILEKLRTDLKKWVALSTHHEAAFGETKDGRPRFDIDTNDHRSDHPSLRRIASPTEISEAYYDVAMNSKMSELVGQLIGKSGTKFHHSKINAKLPHTETSVKWHQDFPFTPHTNDDMVTALLMIDPVTLENGPLQVIPASHKDTLYDHWQDGKFTGTVADHVIESKCTAPISCIGDAGSVCFMHTRLLHSSGANKTDFPRNLFIVVYAAEDALALSDNPLPSQHENQLVYGKSSGYVRLAQNQLRLPQKPQGASFFVQQQGLDKASN